MKRLLLFAPVVATLFGFALLPVRSAPAPRVMLAKRITNSIGMKLAYIPPGKGLMGSPKTEKDRDGDETEHSVQITKGFYLGVHEVTQKQFREVMGYNPSYFSKDGKKRNAATKYDDLPAGGKEEVAGLDTSDFPVENVSWEDAQEFLKKLNGLAAEKEKKRMYRLPSEAEWEYSCRGGAVVTTPFHFGNTLSTTQANFDYKLKRPCKVGSYKANGFGLYDMHGNVYEWCAVWYGTYPAGPVTDPTGPSSGSDRVFRGGSWRFSSRFCRSACRSLGGPSFRFYSLGFRVALVPAP